MDGGGSWQNTMKIGLPVIGVGTFQIKDESVLLDTLRASLKAGYTLIDTASVYKNEELIGKYLKTVLEEVGLRREDIFITSKLSPRDHGHDSARASIMQSLNLLQCEYLDLYLIHWPGKAKLKCEDAKNREFRKSSWEVLEEFHQQKLLKNIGVSNYTIAHLEDMTKYAKIMPAVNQVEFHPHLYQYELLEYCEAQNIQVQAYSSLGTGELVNNTTVKEVAALYGKSSAQILLKWGIQHNVGVIPKSTKKEHICSNMDIFNFTISDDDMKILDGMNMNKHYCWDPSYVL